MIPEDFLAGLTGSRDDFRLAAEALRASRRPFCLIGGLAVNHYVEPVITLDAVNSLQLKVGDHAYAVIKASSVMIAVD